MYSLNFFIIKNFLKEKGYRYNKHNREFICYSGYRIVGKLKYNINKTLLDYIKFNDLKVCAITELLINSVSDINKFKTNLSDFNQLNKNEDIFFMNEALKEYEEYLISLNNKPKTKVKLKNKTKQIKTKQIKTNVKVIPKKDYHYEFDF